MDVTLLNELGVEPHRRREQRHEDQHQHAAIEAEPIHALFIVDHEAAQGIDQVCRLPTRSAPCA
jgi:hypothetical protein